MADKVNITKFVEDNDPEGLIKELGTKLAFVIKSFNNNRGSCQTTNFDLLEDINCRGLGCLHCPFNNSTEEAKNWLRGK